MWSLINALLVYNGHNNIASMIQSLSAALCLLLLATERATAFSFGVPRGRITTHRLSATFHLSMGSKDDDNDDYDGNAAIVEQEEAMEAFGAFLEPNTNLTTLLSNMMETPPELHLDNLFHGPNKVFCSSNVPRNSFIQYIRTQNIL